MLLLGVRAVSDVLALHADVVNGRPLAIAGERFALIESNWAKRRFPNGCGRLALCAWEEKSQRAGIVAVLKDWQVICLAAGSMIMIGIMLYNDWQQ
jgi:hypothetical protein